jgi:pimeloyl-ACP methyl ester carboxylesterase
VTGRRCCIAYDQRGHGRSSQHGYGYEYDTLADDLASLLEQLDLREVTLVGHSMGCGEIVRYLSRHGSSRVARAVFIGTATPFALKTRDNPDGVDKAVIDKLRASWAKDFPRWLGDNARPFFVPETSPEMVQWVVGMCLQASLKALIDCNHAINETDFRAELAAMTVPTLVKTCSRSSKVDVSLPDASRDSASRCVGLFTGAVDFLLKRKHGGVLANLSERRLRRSAETEGALWVRGIEHSFFPNHEQPFSNPVMEGWSTIGSESIHTEGRTRVETKSSARL